MTSRFSRATFERDPLAAIQLTATSTDETNHNYFRTITQFKRLLSFILRFPLGTSLS